MTVKVTLNTKSFAKEGGEKKGFSNLLSSLLRAKGRHSQEKGAASISTHHPSPAHHLLGLPTFPQGLYKGYHLHQHSFMLHWPWGEIVLVHTGWQTKTNQTADGLRVGMLPWQYHPAGSCRAWRFC